jgi:hypothetical protein
MENSSLKLWNEKRIIMHLRLIRVYSCPNPVPPPPSLRVRHHTLYTTNHAELVRLDDRHGSIWVKSMALFGICSAGADLSLQDSQR